MQLTEIYLFKLAITPANRLSMCLNGFRDFLPPSFAGLVNACLRIPTHCMSDVSSGTVL